MLPHFDRPIVTGAIVGAVLVVMSIGLFWMLSPSGEPPGPTLAGESTTTLLTEPTETTGVTRVSNTVIEPSTTTSPTLPDGPLNTWVDRRQVFLPYGTAVDGLITFRGNTTGTYYGQGPVPSTPTIKWSFPDSPMCSSSTDLGVTSTWCGTGWTGQPLVWERPDGITEMIFGGYDRRLHFLDAESGQPTRSPILTGDLIKGTPTLDPDGHPLLYFGSRDNKLRIVALDRAEPVVVWDFEVCLPTSAACPEPSDRVAIEGRWNDDWDSSPRIVNDFMFEGAENSMYYIWRLNRSYDDLGLVAVDPQLKFKMETWTEGLLNDIGGVYPAVSVENSTAIFEGRAYFANSGGRVIGLDITNINNGIAPIVLDYWMGDDVDASIVVDEEGMIYVAAEYERYLDRAKSVGQLVKLDPYNPDDPYVWGMYSTTDSPAKGGMWSTPALGRDAIYCVTNRGFLIAVDRDTGEEKWVFEVGQGSWSSPVIVDDRLIVASNDGLVRSFNIAANEFQPVLMWTFPVGGGHIEATPAVWNGMIYIGSRDGYMYAIGEQNG
jgi:outer membrane protein assembly factor BamB